jgi:hypothetical protein
MTMRERWVEFMRIHGFTGHVLAQDAVKAAMDFAASEVRLALQPREQAHDENCDSLELSPSLGPSTKPCNCRGRSEQAPGLELAERNLRDGYVVVESQSKAIADELDRLRGGLRSIGESLDCMLYVEPMGGQHAVRPPRRPLSPSERGELEELRALVRSLGGEP